MKRLGLVIAILFSLGALDPLPALAGRPLVTEDAGTIEKGFFGWQLSLDYSRESNHDKNYIPAAQLAYGLTERAEVAVTGSYIFRDIHEGGREDGWGDMVAYLKYRVWEEGKDYPAFTLKPSLKIPTASEDKGLGSGKADYGLTAVFSKAFGGGALHFNIGYTLIGKKEATDELNLGLAGEYGLRKWLVGVSEIRYTQNFNSDSNDDPASFLIGLQVSAGKTVWDAGLSLGLNKAAPDYAFTIGVTIKFR